MHPIEILERYWNFTSFKPLQEHIIESVIAKTDTFALLPTGGGKSLCYQIPGLYFEGLCIVISPLIALMQNQVKDLRRKGVKAIALTSGMTYKDLDVALDNAIYGKYKFLYLSPERLQQQLVKDRIQQMKVSLIAVDEAHCISQWGYDFRPSYLQLNQLRAWHPTAVCIALTATAKQEIIEDITSALDFIHPRIFKASFKRDNIALKVIETEDKWFQLCQTLDTSLGSSIIYVRTRKSAKMVSQQLNEAGYSSSFYHGGLSNDHKSERLNAWMNNRIDTMVATTAFGMGIDKENVDTVIHYNLPESLESYYQEVGRAGRNGLPAKGVLIHKPADKELLRKQFIANLPSINDIKFIYKKLCNYFQIAYGEKVDDTFQFNFSQFCKTYDLNGQITFNCLEVLDRNSIIDVNQQFNFKTRIQFLTDNNTLFAYLDKHHDLDIVVKTLLRTYGGIFDYDTKVNLDLLLRKLKMKENDLISKLLLLEKHELIRLKLANSDSEITFIKPREDDITINPYAKIINQQIILKKKQVASVIAYINNDKQCRQQQILEYFGESPEGNCGICNACTERKQIKHSSSLETKVIQALTSNSLSSRELSKRLNIDSNRIVATLKKLLELNKIETTKSNTYKCKNL